MCAVCPRRRQHNLPTSTSQNTAATSSAHCVPITPHPLSLSLSRSVLPRPTPHGALASCSALCSQIEDIFLHNLKSNTSFLQEDRGCVLHLYLAFCRATLTGLFSTPVSTTCPLCRATVLGHPLSLPSMAQGSLTRGCSADSSPYPIFVPLCCHDQYVPPCMLPGTGATLPTAWSSRRVQSGP